MIGTGRVVEVEASGKKEEIIEFKEEQVKKKKKKKKIKKEDEVEVITATRLYEGVVTKRNKKGVTLHYAADGKNVTMTWERWRVSKKWAKEMDYFLPPRREVK